MCADGDCRRGFDFARGTGGGIAEASPFELASAKWTAAELLIDLGRVDEAREYVRSLVGEKVGGCFLDGSRVLPDPIEMRGGGSGSSDESPCRLFGRIGEEELLRKHRFPIETQRAAS